MEEPETEPSVVGKRDTPRRTSGDDEQARRLADRFYADNERLSLNMRLTRGKVDALGAK